MIMGMKRKIKIPVSRIKYHSIVGVDKGLNSSIPSTMIADNETPSCEEMVFLDGKAEKNTGCGYFGDTDNTPLIGGCMGGYHYKKRDESDKFVFNTQTNTYSYNGTLNVFECITRGKVIDDCESAWTPAANVTCSGSTDCRKGSGSAKINVAAAFTTGIAASTAVSSMTMVTGTNIHCFIKSDIDTSDGDLRLRVSEQAAGGAGASYADYDIVALTADVWKEISVALSSPAADGGGTYPDDLDAVVSTALVVVSDLGAQTLYVDDVMCTIENSGDDDNHFAALVVNDLYIESNGLAPIRYWDMAASNMAVLSGCVDLAATALGGIGSRLCLYGVVDGGLNYPQKVQWTVAGGVSSPPLATNWSGTGSGDTTLTYLMGQTEIMNALPMGAYYIIYGGDVIVVQEYNGKVTNSYDFSLAVKGVGLAASRAIVTTGNEHIFLGFENIYSYSGGRKVVALGDKIKEELFSSISPENVGRCFMVYKRRTDTVILYYPKVGEETVSNYFSYNIKKKSWSKGTRAYTGHGKYKIIDAPTWDNVGDSADTTWDEMASRWNDSTLDNLNPVEIYGTSDGEVVKDSGTSLNDLEEAIDGWWETKDLVVGEGYRRTNTFWESFGFEAQGDTLNIYYSTDLGVTWSNPKTFSLTSDWKQYEYNFEVYSPQVRFKIRNNTISETFEFRSIEIGYVECSDRGVA